MIRRLLAGGALACALAGPALAQTAAPSSFLSQNGQSYFGGAGSLLFPDPVDGHAHVVRPGDPLPVQLSSIPLPAGAATSAGLAAVLAAETANTFFAANTASLAAAGAFTGPTRDVGVGAGTGQPLGYFNAAFYADQSETAYVELSDDGSTWTPAIAPQAVVASTPVTTSVPILARYYRVRELNGATAQTVHRVSSSFSRN